MARLGWLGVWLVVCLLGYGQCQVVWDSYSQPVALSEGQAHVIQCVNEPLEMVTHLWSYRHVQIETYEPVCVSVMREGLWI
jgi:hypothetical protein